MKVFHIAASLSPEWGGPVKIIQELIEALVRKGIEVSIFAPAFFFHLRNRYKTEAHLIREGENGVFLQPEDVVGLREMIAKLVAQPHLRRAMG